MSCPLSAWRAIDSADAVRFVLEVFFIKLLLFASGSPQRHEVIVFPIIVFPDFKNHGMEPPFDPADCAVLVGLIHSPIHIVRVPEYLLSFFKTNPALRILSESNALLLVKLEAHERTL